MLFVFCLLAISVFLLVTSNVSGVVDDVLAAGYSFAFSIIVETFLVTARVL